VLYDNPVSCHVVCSVVPGINRLHDLVVMYEQALQFHVECGYGILSCACQFASLHAQARVFE
jgi:hypothetical protein